MRTNNKRKSGFSGPRFPQPGRSPLFFVVRHTVLSVFVAILCMLLVSAAAIWWYAGQTTVPGGITVSGMKGGGLTFAQFVAKLQEQAASLERIPVIIFVDDGSVPAQDLLESSPTEASSSAPGGSGGSNDTGGIGGSDTNNINNAYIAAENTSGSGSNDLAGTTEVAGTSGSDGSVELSGSTGAVETAELTDSDVHANLANSFVTAAPSKRSDAPDLFPPAPNDAKMFTLKALGLQTNADNIRRSVEQVLQGSLWDRAQKRWSLRDASMELAIDFDTTALQRWSDLSWPDVQQTKPIDAQRVIGPNDEIRYVPGMNAYRIDVGKLKSALLEQIESFRQASLSGAALPVASVRLPLSTLRPNIPLEQIKNQGVDRKISEYSTPIIGGESGRLHNIRSTAISIGDLLLAPGEVFDYSTFIKKTTERYGYQEAPVILNGVIVPGLGGGICQVSTTIYNAILRSGFEIVERRNHSLPISYAPMGQDATYADGYINFRFRNNSSSYAMVRVTVNAQQVTAKIFGRMPASTSYDIVSRTVETIQPVSKFVRNPKLRAGQQVLLQKGKTGYIVETYRVKKENGKPVATERISRDTYKAQPELVAINNGVMDGIDGNPGGQGKQDSSRRPIIEDGVSGPNFRRN